MIKEVRNVKIEEKPPYVFYRFDIVDAGIEEILSTKKDQAKTLDFVDILETVQRADYTNRVQADIGRMMGGQFIVVNGNYGIWALGRQNGRRVELMLRKDDEISKGYFEKSLQQKL